MFDKNWPQAVDPQFLCQSEQDKVDRAESILEILVNSNLNNLKFLDFGCGEGHVVECAKHKAKFSIGYDPLVSCCNDWNIVLNNAPYDIILLYDVLDHVVDPLKTLEQIRSVSHNHTEIIVRCHPWISRHGGHLYQTNNYAFAHLFTPCSSIQKVIFPIKTYAEWFENSRFKIIEENCIIDEPEKFFLTPDKISVINGLLNGDEKPYGWPFFQMSQSFRDYRLQINV